MKLMKWATDGGKKSGVNGLFVVESKRFFSIVILKFKPGSREAYHSHAFNAYSWIVKGKFVEHKLGGASRTYSASLRPKKTPRSNCHKVQSIGTTWVFSIRGPWQSTWKEYRESTNSVVTLASGRCVVDEIPYHPGMELV